MIHSIQPLPILQEEFPFSVSEEFLATVKMDYKEANNNYFSKNNQILDLPELESLKTAVELKLKEFQTNVVCIEQELYITDSWIAETVSGGWHAVHNHPNSLFSGVIYLQTPSNSSIWFQYENNLFKWFNFQYTYTNRNEFNADSICVKVKEGDIVIFPSWLNHSVDINYNEKSRIILGFNTFVKGNFGNNKYPTRLKL